MRAFLLTIAFAGAFTGCSVRKTPTPPPQTVRLTNHDYVDLEPGWRVKVVTPILKSGKFRLNKSAITYKDGGLVVKAGPDFVGYEIAYYSVVSRRGGGVSIRFSSAETLIGGKRRNVRRPLVSLFDLPDGERFVRLLFLTRVSEADHDQGILAAASMQELVQATHYVLADPEANCRTHQGVFCSWVPAGIAAQAEKRTADGKRWVWTR